MKAKLEMTGLSGWAKSVIEEFTQAYSTSHQFVVQRNVSEGVLVLIISDGVKRRGEIEDESTSSRVARIAARGLAEPGSLNDDEIQAVCASALTQVESRS
jgi:hypothetical protein